MPLLKPPFVALLCRLVRQAVFSSTATATTTTTAVALDSSPTSATATVKSVARSLLGERNLRKQVDKFKEFSKSDRFRRSVGIYEPVLRRLTIAGQRGWIEEILEDQKKYKDVEHEGFCIRLISLYGKAGMFDHASKVFDEMPGWSCNRSVNSLNALLAACVNAKQFDKVEGLFRDLAGKLSLKPDIVSYNTLIKGLCQKGSLDLAVSLLDEIESNGLKPDLITFNTLLNGFYGNSRALDGEKIWERMSKYEVVPDVRSYNARFLWLASEKNVKKALELLDEMKKIKLVPNSVTFNLVMKCCRNEGNVEQAKELYHELRKRRCIPDKATYSTLLPFVCEKGDLDFAFLLCEKIFHDRCLVHRYVLQNVVDELAKASKSEEAKKVCKLSNSNKFCNYKLKLPLSSIMVPK